MESLQHNHPHPAPIIPTVSVTTVPYWGISVSEASSSQMNSALYPTSNHHPYLQLNPPLPTSPHISSNHSSHSIISSNSLRFHGPSRMYPSTPTPPQHDLNTTISNLNNIIQELKNELSIVRQQLIDSNTQNQSLQNELLHILRSNHHTSSPATSHISNTHHFQPPIPHTVTTPTVLHFDHHRRSHPPS